MGLQMEQLERRAVLATRAIVALLLVLTISGYIMMGAMIYHALTWDSVEPGQSVPAQHPENPLR